MGFPFPKKHYHLLGGLGLGFLLFFLLPAQVLAFCPLCAVATGAGVGFFRWLGVDDTIIGLWLGGFVLSATIWLNKFLISKGKKIKFQLPGMIAILYGFIVGGLYWTGFIKPYNKIWGLNKILFGLIVGSFLLFLTPFFDKFLRRRNQGKIFISHQKMLLALGLLLIFSLIFYLITK